MDGTATGATATTATTARPDIRLSVVSKDSAPLVPGRRKFFRSATSACRRRRAAGCARR
jgi:hypothetical protein